MSTAETPTLIRETDPTGRPRLRIEWPDPDNKPDCVLMARDFLEEAVDAFNFYHGAEPPANGWRRFGGES